MCSLEMVKLLTELFGFEKHLVNTHNQNALYSAVSSSKYEFVEYLLSEKLKFVPDEAGLTVFHVAAMNNDL